ncbi:MAG: HD domain-containing protein [Ilumatobacteraceae bacterium]
MKPSAKLGHLARRFFGSLSRRPPAAGDVAWVLTQLLPAELALWQSMPAQDRRHSIVVARRFAGLVADASRAEVAGALLHDVGKTQSGLGTIGRVAATVVGPRTKRFASYHDHEPLGVGMLRNAGSELDTLALIEGTGRSANALRDADAI